LPLKKKCFVPGSGSVLGKKPGSGSVKNVHGSETLVQPVTEGTPRLSVMSGFISVFRFGLPEEKA